MKKTIIVHNLLVQYYSFPSRRAIPVFLLHGWRSEGAIWDNIARKLNNDGYSVYILDLPGFGGSAVPKKAFTLSDYANIVFGFLEKMNIKKGIFIGHSFGGRVAIKLSTSKPELVSTLVLVDCAGFADKSKKPIKLLAKFIKPLFTPSWMQGIRQFIYKTIGSEDYLATPELQQTFVNIIEEDLSPDLKKIPVPTLLVWGEKDNVTPVSFGERMHEFIPHSQLIILPSAGHFSFLDKPEEFYQTLKRFLK